MIDWGKCCVFKNVNTIKDRKKIITGAIRFYIKKGLPIIFAHQSFWQAFYFYNSFKNTYKNLIKFYPKYKTQLNCINFTDYYGFLKFVILTSTIPKDFHLFIFDFDMLYYSKYFPLYNVIFQEGIKFSATFSSLAQVNDFTKFNEFEKIYKLKSTFKIKKNFKIIEKFSIPSYSIFLSFDRNILYKMIQKEIGNENTC